MKSQNFGQLMCKPLAKHIGAEIRNIDLTQKLSCSELQSIHDALVFYQVIFFRDQDISSENHKDLASFFGPVQVHPAYPHVEEYPEICILESTSKKPTLIELWHTDMTFSKTPPLGSILRAWEIPKQGGDTLWASTSAAYDALSKTMKNILEDLVAIHSFSYGFKESINLPGGDEKFKQNILENPPVLHPIVRTHPVTKRKGLFVNKLFTTHIKNMKSNESEMLLNFLYEHMEQEKFSVRFKWQKNSIAFWDNRLTIHRPVNDYFPAYRQLRRITIDGDRPE
jgi:taurine dioxygenase